MANILREGFIGFGCVETAHISLGRGKIAMSENILDGGGFSPSLLSYVSERVTADVESEWLSKEKQTGEDKT